ncbi:MAG: methylenetetrahydrofolate reductase [NAD(P)H] [candidate division Zixibacteria bacterium]|nr:methylenetetrahydrofolate reductase [NAD(P)H] [candidate division Zixibacteria bacterium]
MKVIEHLEKANNPLFSYEIIPPKRGRNAQAILDIVEQLVPYEPPFIDVTSHSAQAAYQESEDGTITRSVTTKRPGTMGICTLIQHRYQIDSVPHLLCRGFTKEESEDAVIEMNFLGINNVMAIRGDDTNFKKTKRQNSDYNTYASDLVKQLDGLRNGKYLEPISNCDPIDNCIGVCCYPEKHIEAANLKTDIQNFKFKVNAGADYAVTQMFYDNKKYFEFVEKCRLENIEIPIIPGIKILSSAKQINSLPRNFNISLPEQLVDDIQSNPKHAREIGLNWGIEQCRELLNNGVKCIHFYILNDSNSVTKLINNL